MKWKQSLKDERCVLKIIPKLWTQKKKICSFIFVISDQFRFLCVITMTEKNQETLIKSAKANVTEKT